MQTILKWLMALTFAAIQFIGYAENFGCHVDFPNPGSVSKYYVHCICTDTTYFPDILSDYNTTIRSKLSLTITASTEEKLKFEADHLKIFNLTDLKIAVTGNTYRIELSSGLLQQFPHLESLDISGLKVIPPQIPTSVKVLIAESLANNSHPDMTHLDNLEILSFTNNYLEDFPKVSEKALLYEVNLSGNSLKNMVYKDIAPYCLMRVLQLKGSLINLDAEKCCGLKKWMLETNTSSDIHCGEEDANCNARIKNLDEEAIALYYNCLSRTGMSEPGSIVEFSFQIILSLALISALGFLVYRYYRSHAVRAFRESQKAKNLANLQFSNDEEEELEEN